MSYEKNKNNNRSFSVISICWWIQSTFLVSHRRKNACVVVSHAVYFVDLSFFIDRCFESDKQFFVRLSFWQLLDLDLCDKNIFSSTNVPVDFIWRLITDKIRWQWLMMKLIWWIIFCPLSLCKGLRNDSYWLASLWSVNEWYWRFLSVYSYCWWSKMNNRSWFWWPCFSFRNFQMCRDKW